MNEAKRNQVFISYAKNDLENVKKVVHGLKKRNLHVWFDKEDLAPGRWKPQILKAIAYSRYFVICISVAALRKIGDKPGFQDNELQTAYEIAQAQPDHEFTIVPVRLEDCEGGDFRITSFQQYDLYLGFEKGLDKLAVKLGGISLSDATKEDERTKDEKIIDSLFSKTNTFFYARDYEKAVSVLNTIIVLKPGLAEAWKIKGFALYKLWLQRPLRIRGQSRPNEAWDAFSEALSIDRSNSTKLRQYDSPVDIRDGDPIKRLCLKCGYDIMSCNWSFTSDFSYFYDHYWHTCHNCGNVVSQKEQTGRDYNLQDCLADPSHCPLCGRRFETL